MAEEMELLDSYCRAIHDNKAFAYARMKVGDRDVVIVAERDRRWLLASIRDNGVYIEYGPTAEENHVMPQEIMRAAQRLVEQLQWRPAAECDCLCGHCPCCEYGCMCYTRR
jgi:hypothetical protein